jgi:putative transposase
VFQGRFKSKAIEGNEYLATCGRYIERNPVRAGMLDKAERFEFSSARFYALGIKDGLTQESPLFESFGQDAASRQKAYSEFLIEKDQEDDVREFSNFEKPRGSQEFLRRLVKERGVYVPRRGRLLTAKISKISTAKTLTAEDCRFWASRRENNCREYA